MPNSQGSAEQSVPVTADNFIRAESDLYFSNIVKDGGFGKFFHFRTPAPIEHQTVIRLNRDTLYSAAVFDLDSGPVTITLPDAGNRFMSLQVINEDQYTLMVAYGKGTYPVTKDKIGTRYVVTAIRTLVNPDDPKISTMFTPCRTQSSYLRGVRASLKSPTGIWRARRRCVKPCLYLDRLFPTQSACLGRSNRPNRSVALSEQPWPGVAIPKKKQPI